MLGKSITHILKYIVHYNVNLDTVVLTFDINIIHLHQEDNWKRYIFILSQYSGQIQSHLSFKSKLNFDRNCFHLWRRKLSNFPPEFITRIQDNPSGITWSFHKKDYWNFGTHALLHVIFEGFAEYHVVIVAWIIEPQEIVDCSFVRTVRRCGRIYVCLRSAGHAGPFGSCSLIADADQMPHSRGVFDCSQSISENWKGNGML